MENALAILGVGVVAGAITCLVALLSSSRTRRHGLWRAIWSEVSVTAKHRNPYKD